MARFHLRAVLLLIALLSPLPLAAQEGRSLHWSELTVEAHLDAEGRLHVRETQGMVFDGDWNGGERRFQLRQGQHLHLEGITRIEAAAGERVPLVEDEPDRVDEYAWAEDNTVRWRSRAEADPPFSNQEIVYELRYVLWPVLIRGGEGEYRLAHDFAFAGRDGVIERFQVDLTLDSAWTSPFGPHIRETTTGLPPGEGYTIALSLERVAPGEPVAAPPPPPAWAGTGIAAGALAVPLLVLLALRRRGRELEDLAPLVPPGEIDETWLHHHIFAHSAETVGTAWDRSVGEPEVAALLARLVAEGKLSSRVETEGGEEPVLYLKREVPLSEFAEHERELIEGLFFDGREETSTREVREHYEKEGFDPASRIRKALESSLESLPGRGHVPRPMAIPLTVLVAGVLLTIFLPDRTGRALVVVMGIVAAGVSCVLLLPLAVTLGRRVTQRTGLMIAITLVLLLPSIVLALLASGVVYGGSTPAFYRPGAWLLLGLLVLLAGVGLLVVAIARSTETLERLAFRRRLVSAREYFAAELDRPEPRLKDAWFPYLLAFGLGSHVDRWFRSFGPPDHGGSTATFAAAGAGAVGRPASSPSGGWTGGGPQFGGGTFAGGGAGGAWGVAAAGMAAGVAAPSSTGGGGGGVAVSGGGGGGGW